MPKTKAKALAKGRGKPKTRTKAGTSSGAADARKQVFVDTYLSNGRNGTQAAIAAGFSVKSASVTASTLLREPKVSKMVAERLAETQRITGLTIERTLLEVARIAYQDPRRLYHDDGTVKQPHEWDDDTAAFVASVEVDEAVGTGKDKAVVARTRKLKLWDKNAALDKALKHLGLYEKDNKQRIPVTVEIELVG